MSHGRITGIVSRCSALAAAQEPADRQHDQSGAAGDDPMLDVHARQVWLIPRQEDRQLVGRQDEINHGYAKQNDSDDVADSPHDDSPEEVSGGAVIRADTASARKRPLVASRVKLMLPWLTAPCLSPRRVAPPGAPQCARHSR